MSINEYKDMLNVKGISFQVIGDYSIRIPYIKITVEVHETLSEKLLVQIYDNNNDKKIASNTYKTFNGVKNFIKKHL